MTLMLTKVKNAYSRMTALRRVSSCQQVTRTVNKEDLIALFITKMILIKSELQIRARLFKTNDVVS